MKMVNISWYLFMFLAIIEQNGIDCNNYRSLDEKTKKEMMKIGRKIFGGQHQQPKKKKSLDTGVGDLDAKQTWKVFQTIDRQNTLDRLRNQMNKENKRKGTFVFGKHYQANGKDLTAKNSVTLPTVMFGFSMVTKVNIPLGSKQTMEIHDYEISKDGTFERGAVTNKRLGRFEASISGIYQFHVIVHVALPRNIKELQRKDFVMVSLCIDGECRKKMTISSISGFENNSRIFSVNLSGFLHLQGQQKVSIFVVNKSPRYDINILKGSYFSGMLVGV